MQIEKHELLEMRRVAAYIYKKAGRWKQSIALSKKDNLYKDAMETCSQSGDRELSEELLVYFIEQVCVLFFFQDCTRFLNNVRISYLYVINLYLFCSSLSAPILIFLPGL